MPDTAGTELNKSKLLQSFFIDDGQLEGLPNHQCFVLGVEWQMVYSQILEGFAFSRALRIENKDRIEKMLWGHGRRYTVKPHDDEWLWLEVEKSDG